MLASPGPPPEAAGWAFGFKWDGVRAIIAAAGDEVRISSRNGNEVTRGYPEIVAAGLGAGRSVLLDGELPVAAGTPESMDAAPTAEPAG
jgi:bifunctional non-homologous end joining protein LigD